MCTILINMGQAISDSNMGLILLSNYSIICDPIKQRSLYSKGIFTWWEIAGPAAALPLAASRASMTPFGLSNNGLPSTWTRKKVMLFFCLSFDFIILTHCWSFQKWSLKDPNTSKNKLLKRPQRKLHPFLSSSWPFLTILNYLSIIEFETAALEDKE